MEVIWLKSYTDAVLPVDAVMLMSATTKEEKAEIYRRFDQMIQGKAKDIKLCYITVIAHHLVLCLLSYVRLAGADGEGQEICLENAETRRGEEAWYVFVVPRYLHISYHRVSTRGDRRSSLHIANGP